MDLASITKKVCQKNNIVLSRSKGQNFLIEESVYDEIVEAADIKKDDVVLEVGPGFGFLTEKLARKAKKLIAVELDDKLAKVLRDRLEEKGIKNVEVVNEDIMKLEIGNWKLGNIYTNFKFQISNFKVVANLPYNITSIFLRKFLSGENKPKEMVLMLQKEVAERIIARPPKMSILAVSVQFYSLPEIIKIVPSESFWPVPEVDSAIVKLNNTPLASPLPPAELAGGQARGETHPLRPLSRGETHPPVPSPSRRIGGRAGKRGINEKEFFQLVKIGFSARRKMLKNNLAGGYKISQPKAEEKIIKAGFNAKVRAQELSVEDWLELLKQF